MIEGLLGTGVAVVIVARMAIGVREYWSRCPGSGWLKGEATFRRWLMRGLGAPALLWFLWHFLALFAGSRGVSPLVTPVAGGKWPSFLLGSAAFLVAAGLLWTVVSLAWMLPTTISGIRRIAAFRLRALVQVGLVVPVVVWAAARESWPLLILVPAVGLWWLTRTALRFVHVPHVSYLRAVARIKFGRYADAEQEILRQLEEKEDDYQGWMLLAALYAEQFNDLAGAEQTIRDLTSQPDLTAYQVAHAFNRLAEWQLHRGGNPQAAREALEEVERRCPGTPFAQVAAHRLRELPLDEAEYREQSEPRRLRLPALSGPIAAATPDPDPVSRLDARNEAARLESRLLRRPDDVETRERLARLLAERLGQVEDAVAQLVILRRRPDAPALRRAEWLALEASWELRIRGREQRARTLLEQLLREHPDTPQSLAARRQLELLDRAAEVAAAPAVLPEPRQIRIVLRDHDTPPPPGP
ncbi:MAG: tetratricopeptide repeat protein [Verrucomicrobiae bacterium]|nr:tetratricopeptide repeat protein [Verrucomicrobiae bacterium]